MPTVDYVFISPSEINHEICVISDAEWERREEESHRWESDGRCARREISVFDAMLAELIDDRNAEKAKVRNRRKADRKAKRKSGSYIKRTDGKFRKDEHYAGDKFLHYPESLMMPETRVRSKEKYDRADWEIDLRGIEYDISYAEMEISSCEEDIDDLNREIQLIEYQLSDVENLKERLKTLNGFVEETKQYMRNSQEFLHKYNFVKEMM